MTAREIDEQVRLMRRLAVYAGSVLGTSDPDESVNLARLVLAGEDDPAGRAARELGDGQGSPWLREAVLRAAELDLAARAGRLHVARVRAARDRAGQDPAGEAPAPAGRTRRSDMRVKQYIITVAPLEEEDELDPAGLAAFRDRLEDAVSMASTDLLGRAELTDPDRKTCPCGEAWADEPGHGADKED